MKVEGWAVKMARDERAIRLRRTQGAPGLPAVDDVTLGAGNEVIVVSQLVDLVTVRFPDDLLTTYIVPAGAVDGVPAFVCPFCGRGSYHPKDGEERYCGACHVFIDDEMRRRAVEEELDGRH